MTYAMIRSQFVSNARKSNRRALECSALGYKELAQECREMRDWWISLAR